MSEPKDLRDHPARVVVVLVLASEDDLLALTGEPDYTNALRTFAALLVDQRRQAQADTIRKGVAAAKEKEAGA